MAAGLWTLHATHTHLYPGARLWALPDAALSPSAGDALVIEFADLTVGRAQCLGVVGDELHLAVDCHRTRSGTVVAPRRWRAQRLRDEQGREGLRIAGLLGHAQ